MADGEVRLEAKRTLLTNYAKLSVSNCSINFNTYKYALSNFPFMFSIIFENQVEWQDFVISSQLLCIFIEGKKPFNL